MKLREILQVWSSSRVAAVGGKRIINFLGFKKYYLPLLAAVGKLNIRKSNDVNFFKGIYS